MLLLRSVTFRYHLSTLDRLHITFLISYPPRVYYVEKLANNVIYKQRLIAGVSRDCWECGATVSQYYSQFFNLSQKSQILTNASSRKNSAAPAKQMFNGPAQHARANTALSIMTAAPLQRYVLPFCYLYISIHNYDPLSPSYDITL